MDLDGFGFFSGRKGFFLKRTGSPGSPLSPLAPGSPWPPWNKKLPSQRYWKECHIYVIDQSWSIRNMCNNLSIPGNLVTLGTFLNKKNIWICLNSSFLFLDDVLEDVLVVIKEESIIDWIWIKLINSSNRFSGVVLYSTWI